MLIEKYNSRKPMESNNYILKLNKDNLTPEAIDIVESQFAKAVENIYVAKASNDLTKFEWLSGYTIKSVKIDTDNSSVTIHSKEDGDETVRVTEEDAKLIKFASIYLSKHSFHSVDNVTQFFADAFFNGDLDMLYFSNIATSFSSLEKHTDATVLEAWEKGEAKFSEAGQKALTNVKKSISQGIKDVMDDYSLFELQVSNKFVLRLYKSCVTKGTKKTWKEDKMKAFYQACAMLYLDKLGVRCAKDKDGEKLDL